MIPSMDKFVCGVDALRYWHVPGVEGLCSQLTEVPRILCPKYPTYRGDDSHLLTGSICGNIRKYVVGDVCKAELVFAQLARFLSDTELIYLALQICSRQGNFTPLTDVRSLRRCVRSLAGFCNRTRILRILRYVQDRSYSAMESFTYMFVALPQSYGGAGLNGFQFNVRIDTGKSVRRTFYGDLVDSVKKIIIEFDSRTYHDNPRSYVEDNVRASILEENGWQVVSVRAAQLMDERLFRVLLGNVAKRLGVRLRIRSPRYRRGCEEIRRLMLRECGYGFEDEP